MPIYVLFAPSSFGIFKSALVLKPDRGPRFQVSVNAIFQSFLRALSDTTIYNSNIIFLDLRSRCMHMVERALSHS